MSKDSYSKKVIIGMFISYKEIINILSDKITTRNEISIIDFTNINMGLAKDYMRMNEMDIVVISSDVFEDSKTRNEIITLIEANCRKQDNYKTNYVIVYNTQNAGKIKGLNDILLDKKLPVTNCKIDTDNDKIILVQTLQGIINSVISANKRRDILLSKLKES